MQQDELARQLGAALSAKHWRMASAESCTGGGVAVAVTDIAGSSEWFDRAFVTYSNESKRDMLGVDLAIIEHHGAVSRQTVEQMAQGALRASRANISVAISGVAGPGGGSETKPVGTVWIAWADEYGRLSSHCFQFTGDRFAVRSQAIVAALRGLINIVEQTP